MTTANLILLKPSRILIALVLLSHALALAVMLMLDMILSIQLVCILILGLSLLWQVRRAMLMPKAAVIAFTLNEFKDKDQPARLTLLLKRRDGTEQQAPVISGSYVTPFYTGIRYRVETKGSVKRWHLLSGTLPLFRDSLDAEDFRKIRVRMKWS